MRWTRGLFRRRHAGRAEAASVLLALAFAGSAPAPAHAARSSAPAQGAPAAGQPASSVLSDEKRLSRWAHPAVAAQVRRKPRATSRAIARLRFFTEDRLAERYLLLRRFTDSLEHEWIKLRVPMRPNGRTGWVRREALGGFHVVRTWLRIDRRTLRATLFRKGRRIFRARVGIGAPGTPTPAGRFWVRERIRNLGGGERYGPWAFGTSAYSTLSDWPGGGVIGIHGTNEPGLIPGRPSHGCIRMRNRDVRRLARRMPLGTPVRIR